MINGKHLAGVTLGRCGFLAGVTLCRSNYYYETSGLPSQSVRIFGSIPTTSVIHNVYGIIEQSRHDIRLKRDMASLDSIGVRDIPDWRRRRLR